MFDINTAEVQQNLLSSAMNHHYLVLPRPIPLSHTRHATVNEVQRWVITAWNVDKAIDEIPTTFATQTVVGDTPPRYTVSTISWLYTFIHYPYLYGGKKKTRTRYDVTPYLGCNVWLQLIVVFLLLRRILPMYKILYVCW